jgi:hypothetical protein
MSGEFSVSIRDQVTRIPQSPIDVIGHLPDNPRHECVVWRRRDTCDLYFTCRQSNREEHVMRHEAA